LPNQVCGVDVFNLNIAAKGAYAKDLMPWPRQVAQELQFTVCILFRFKPG
jgi:hypothetical protein